MCAGTGGYVLGVVAGVPDAPLDARVLAGALLVSLVLGVAVELTESPLPAESLVLAVVAAAGVVDVEEEDLVRLSVL